MDTCFNTSRISIWFARILATILVLNLLDAVFTLIMVQSGFAREVNPLLSELLYCPVLFMLVKLLVVSLGTILLWRFQKLAMSLIGSLAILAVYIGIIIWHACVIHEVF